ncbi:hypothetical protein K1T71_008046 [Dendrolimus kikuchii]|uniref:Uncharacterized protein n=1 Tax=Dendrolimus kikuchii TaxID=765133 RepID=A0ACC1CZ50_9NEOP|nr:hypothetical protein K1T71_008046 [Dendrolimus kikuchii]
MGCWGRLVAGASRRKVFAPGLLEDTKLKRCLNRWDVTALGVGTTLGCGVHVLIGYVALHMAGPSIVLSFLIAAVAALFAGLCYAEFASRVPRAGAAYTYAYTTVGQLIAFIIAWNNILEVVFGSASLAKGLSIYVDTMTNKTMSQWFSTAMPITFTCVAPYFDLLAFLIVVGLALLLSFGVRESTMVNNVLALINMSTIMFIIIAGAVYADPGNWYLPAADVPIGQGGGGFFPFGVLGTLQGAALCFYGFVGFDTISATGEEVHEPHKVIPYAIIMVLCVTFISYLSVSIVFTMMIPYYLEDGIAAVASAFTHVGLGWAWWVVSVGAIIGILVSLFGALFPLPRLLYAMSLDGLMLGWFSRVTSRKSPAVSTLVSAAVIAILAGLLELNQMLMMVCIGTLLSYTVVAACIIILRYRLEYAPESSISYFKQIFGCGPRVLTKSTKRIIDFCLALYICVCISLSLVHMHIARPLIPSVVLHLAIIILIYVMSVQPKIKEEIYFKTPMVPLIPCISMYVNIHLMILINIQTWIRVGIWSLIGILIYLLLLCFRKQETNLEENMKHFNVNKNGKPPVQIVVESPTPPGTMMRSSNYGGNIETMEEEIEEAPEMEENLQTADITVYQAYVENNEEKEAKIIDLLDQVLQAEEDTYGETISLKDREDVVIIQDIQRKSLSELSDAGSDASMGNQVLSKYDVIAQVHREDLPKVAEEEEKYDPDIEEEVVDVDEEVTAFNDDSETNSRTDESGYSDTYDRNLNESVEEVSNIPVPPPLPLDENYFRSSNFKKSYTIPARPIQKTEAKESEEEDENKPRESVQSNNSQGDGNITFGSDRQIHFMSKLNNIFQNKISSSDDEEPRKRSHSTGNVTDGTDFSVNRERPSIFLDLKKEIISREAAQNLRPTNVEDKSAEDTEEVEEISMSRDDLKSKLETIFAAGGPQLLKPRLMKSNPPTPEEAYQTDTSSTESITKIPKMEKMDTLKRQKAKFGEVMKSFRLSLNKDDDI